MNEKPIERLNFYNGQRLEAEDLKLEQEYHIRVRRWLNKSLYSAGIAHGLEVNPDPANPQQVVVSPGLALDYEGREIILLEEQYEQVEGKPSKTEGQVDGNYLFIQYREATQKEEFGCCTPRGESRKKGKMVWGGPSRVQVTPVLGWCYFFPHESSGKIVLAQVELDDSCNVQHVYAYPRRYVGPTSLTTVRQFALEGERHIDSKNPGRIYFHIRGRQPNAVTLYLRAEKFSTLYYTELGEHTHSSTVSGATEAANPPLTNEVSKHEHEPGDLTINIGTESDHYHELLARKGYIGKKENNRRAAFFLIERDWAVDVGLEGLGNFLSGFAAPEKDSEVESILDDVDGSIDGGQHYHMIGGSTAEQSFSYDHTHSLSASGSTGTAGVTDVTARSGQTEGTLAYLNSLQVYIGKADPTGVVQPTDEDNYTQKILFQLRSLQPTANWTDGQGHDALGDGDSLGGHALSKNGTGPIRLDLLANTLSFPEGEYCIELRAPEKHPNTAEPLPNNGGRILYNLYVE